MYYPLYDRNRYRIKKQNKAGQETHFLFDTSGKVLEEINLETGEVISSVFLKSRHLARVTEEETLFYGTDHQGSTVLVTDEAGIMVWSGEATPFGDGVVRKSGNRPDLDLKYTGKDLDEDTGLYYFNARWYDAGTGRFISEDPARDGSNWFIYVSNNPLKFTDPTGLWRTREERQADRQERRDRREARREQRSNDRAKENLDKANEQFGKAQNARTALGRRWHASRGRMFQGYGTQHIQNNLNEGRQVSDSVYEAWGKSFEAMTNLYGEQGSDSASSDSSGIGYYDGYMLQGNSKMPGMAREACFFRTYQSMAEHYLGEALTALDIAKSYFSLRKSGDIEMGYFVRQPVNVINDALQRLGAGDLEAIYLGSGSYSDDMKIPSGTTYLRLVGNHQTDSSKVHSVLGDATGTPIWDPSTGEPLESRHYFRWSAFEIKRRGFY